MRNKNDIIGSLFCILLGGAVMIGSARLRLGTPGEPQPGFFPFMAAVILFGLALILLIQALRGRGGKTGAFGELWRPVILIIGLFVYSVVLDFLGYVLATLILSVVILRVLETKTWWKLAAVSLVLSIGTYLLFDRVLGVELPGILAGLN
jgi:putative tricarboxylic transport membrane protein